MSSSSTDTQLFKQSKDQIKAKMHAVNPTILQFIKTSLLPMHMHNLLLEGQQLSTCAIICLHMHARFTTAGN